MRRWKGCSNSRESTRTTRMKTESYSIRVNWRSFAADPPTVIALLLSRRRHSRPGKLFRPVDSPRHLHDHEQRNDRADGDGQTGEAFEEECVGEQDQIHKLSKPTFHQR